MTHTPHHTNPELRHDFVYLFDVRLGNPNGDPDAGNLPRVDPETMHGLVTDVCLKRKVRDYAMTVEGKPIFIQSRDSLNSLIFRAAKSVGIDPPKVAVSDEELRGWLLEHLPEDFEMDGESFVYTGEKFNAKDLQKHLSEALGEEGSADLKAKAARLLKDMGTAAKGKGIPRERRNDVRGDLIKTYFDIRMFGAVLSTGVNAGQVRGPVQFTFGRSIDPIAAMDLSITRVAITREEDRARKSTEMGRKALVPYGLYRAHGFYNPRIAEGVTAGDLALLYEALGSMFEFDRSASRGEMAARGLYVFTHENPKGNAHAHKLFKLIDARRHDGVTSPRDFSDYEVAVPGGGELPPGVSLATLI